jgi:kynurenine formamidase
MALPEELKALAARVSNWGRWGPDDQRGTLNFITPDAVRRGAAAVRRGVSFSLAIPFHDDGPQTKGGPRGRINPQHKMIGINVSFTGDPSDFTTSDDTVEMGIQAATHWDALAHVGYEGLLYNGVPDSVIDEKGAARLGIEHFGAVVTRGVLLDIARLHAVDYLEGGYVINATDLDAATEKAGLTIESGDIVLVRSGHMHWMWRGDKQKFLQPSPGLGVSTIEWCHDHEVAAIAGDTLVFEVWPCENPKALLPVAMINSRDQGLVQGQLWNLDELAADCADDGVYEFLLSATPLPITSAVGGALAPTATK